MSVDHRKLGRELDLYDSDPLIGAGLPFWLPAGAAVRHEIESYLRECERRAGYQHVYSPPLGKRRMFEMSGHWEHFADDMFPPMRLNGEELVLRPSNCPHHALMFRARQRSYREMPVRIAELGPMFRAERSGVVGGLSRVRAMQLNDAHLFCAPEQVGEEVAGVLRLMRQVHAALGIAPARMRLSLRGSGGKFAGNDAMWARSEGLLREALRGFRYAVAAGEGAFYGPKIDVQVVDPAGREFTLATVQVDFHQPERFDVSYRGPDGARHRPVMVHRSLVGSMERLLGHLIEVHGGAFPVWYAPVQLVVLPVGPEQHDAADRLVRAAVAAGLRAEVLVDGSVGARVRRVAERKVPYVGIVGEREVAAGQVALRLRDGRRLPPMPVAAAIAVIDEVATARDARLLPEEVSRAGSPAGRAS